MNLYIRRCSNCGWEFSSTEGETECSKKCKIAATMPTRFTYDFIGSENGIPFRVVLTDFSYQNPVIEFFDRRYGWGDDGQFTGGRYIVGDIMRHTIGAGLDLNGNVDEWRVSAVDMINIMRWLSGLTRMLDK